MRPVIGNDYAVMLTKKGNLIRKVGDRTTIPMNQQQRLAGAIRFIIYVEATNGRIFPNLGIVTVRDLFLAQSR